MAKDKPATASWFFRELFQFSVYKRSQGRIARQVTFATLALGSLIGAYRAYLFLGTNSSWAVVPWIVLLVMLWICFRLVNMPAFADFLIAVEAEMNKVTWPSRLELLRSSIVVIFCIFFLATILFGYDLFWKAFLTVLGIGHR